MNNKVTIIGAGSVGATVAYTLVATGSVAEIVLIDVNVDKAKGEALDIRQATPYLSLQKFIAVRTKTRWGRISLSLLRAWAESLVSPVSILRRRT